MTTRVTRIPPRRTSTRPAFVVLPRFPDSLFRRSSFKHHRGCTSACAQIAPSSKSSASSPEFGRDLPRRGFLYFAAGFGLQRFLPPIPASSEQFTSAYDIVAAKEGSPLPLSKFSGKVTLFVNVATYCALTPQYEGLVSLYDTFQPRGFEIVASPCDQFGHQEPGSNQEICKFAKEQFGARFLLLDKLNVNDGPGGVAPLYQFLKNTSPESTGQRLSWNFEKFLVSTDGRVLRRYKPGILPEQIKNDIAWALDHPGEDLPRKKKASLGVE